ncbi:MAG: prepilin peptidase [Bryobacteraceae bacterium]|nr:prepilin peptidase [Bryobacteraceae bacterium]
MTEAVLAGLAGLIIGSFLNVCIYRMPRDLSVVRPRSGCPSCGTPIAWYDNIPLVSYLLLGGRCRRCRAAISMRYPLVELAVGLLFFAAVWTQGPTVEAVKLCVFAAVMVELVVSDLDSRILPDEFTLGGAAAGLLFAALTPMPPGIVGLLLAERHWRLVSVAESAAGALIGSAALWTVGWLYLRIRGREGLGLGDVKMMAAIGAFLGLHRAFVALMLGSIAGSVIGLLFILLARKDASTYELPYGSFLGAAAVAYAFLLG